jgi:hypothetical protein
MINCVIICFDLFEQFDLAVGADRVAGADERRYFPNFDIGKQDFINPGHQGLVCLLG